ncbi:MAG: glycosyltransferase family 2 protein [Deltaproteobacteria bacterium]|nr:glycosyltransferase family 2 protein [Deltaproteobacteria bacterium]
MPPRLSVIVVVRNEERDLPGCLASVAFADELVVVDAQSTDRTREIAEQAGARVFVRAWPGHAAQKQFALEQATGDWVLNLDADERCSAELRAAIPQLLEDGTAEGYRIRFRTWVFGRRQRFGMRWTERHLRLFRREKGSFPPRAIHECAEVSGRAPAVDAPILHFTYDSLEKFVDKINRYSSLAARERFAQGRRFSYFSLWRWPWGFFKRYVLWLGFLDGWDGLLHAAISGLYDLLKYAKLRDLQHAARLSGKLSDEEERGASETSEASGGSSNAAAG